MVHTRCIGRCQATKDIHRGLGGGGAEVRRAAVGAVGAAGPVCCAGRGAGAAVVADTRAAARAMELDGPCVVLVVLVGHVVGGTQGLSRLQLEQVLQQGASPEQPEGTGQPGKQASSRHSNEPRMHAGKGRYRSFGRWSTIIIRWAVLRCKLRPMHDTHVLNL